MDASEPLPWGEIVLCVTMLGCIAAAVLCDARNLRAVVALDEMFFGLVLVLITMVHAMIRVGPRVARREVVARAPRAGDGYRDAPTPAELVVDGRRVLDLREVVVRHIPAMRQVPERYVLYAVGSSEVVEIDTWRSDRDSALRAAAALRSALGLPAVEDPPQFLNVDWLGLRGFALVGMLLLDVAGLIAVVISIANLRSDAARDFVVRSGIGLGAIVIGSILNHPLMRWVARAAFRRCLEEEFGVSV